MQIYTQNPEPMQNRVTLGSVLSKKFLQFIASRSIGSLLKSLAELSLGIVLGAFIFKPDIVGRLISETLIAQNYAFPKIMAGLIIIYCRKLFYRIPGKIRKFRIRLEKANVQKLHNPMLDGIPVDELADYLVRNGNFRREGVNGARETFGLRMEKYNNLAKKLEENGVLIRGENNLRILSSKWSRQALIDFLSQSENSKTMGPWFRVHRIGANAKVRLDRQEIVPTPMA